MKHRRYHSLVREFGMVGGILLLAAWPVLTLSAEEPGQNPGQQPAGVPGKEGDTVVSAALVSVDVEWSAAPGAVRYQLEIRDAAQKVVLQKEVPENRFRAELPPGTYEKRVGLVNKFSRTYLWSDWSPLQIIVLLQPGIEAPKTARRLAPGSGEKSVTVKTKGVMPQTRYHIVDSKGNDPGASVKVEQKGEEAVVTVDTNQLPPGNYDLVMENPEGQRAVQERLITIAPSSEPIPPASYDPSRGRDWARLTPFHLIPGLPQRHRGEMKKGNALMIAFFSTVAASAYSYQKAALLYRKLGSDPLYAVFKDSTTANVIGPTIAADPALYNTALYRYGSWSEDSASYNRYRIYAYTGAILATGIFAYHVSDVYRFEVGPARTTLGEPGVGAALSLSF